MEVKIISADKDATFKLGELIAGFLKENDIIALEGDLGAGKTKFTSGIAHGLHCDAEIVSPTFTILRDYEKKTAAQRLSLYHFDAYRLKNEKEFEAQGFDEYFDNHGVTIIEWADIIRDILPERTISIYFSIENDGPASEQADFLLDLQDELCDLFVYDEGEGKSDTSKSEHESYDGDFVGNLSGDGDREDQRKRMIKIEADGDLISLLRAEISGLDEESLYIAD